MFLMNWSQLPQYAADLACLEQAEADCHERAALTMSEREADARRRAAHWNRKQADALRANLAAVRDKLREVAGDPRTREADRREAIEKLTKLRAVIG